MINQGTIRNKAFSRSFQREKEAKGRMRGYSDDLTRFGSQVQLFEAELNGLSP
jgi:hypothetical protein